MGQVCKFDHQSDQTNNYMGEVQVGKYMTEWHVLHCYYLERLPPNNPQQKNPAEEAFAQSHTASKVWTARMKKGLFSGGISSHELETANTLKHSIQTYCCTSRNFMDESKENSGHEKNLLCQKRSFRWVRVLLLLVKEALTNAAKVMDTNLYFLPCGLRWTILELYWFFLMHSSFFYYSNGFPLNSFIAPICNWWRND